MAHLWIERDEGEWALATLDAEAYLLDPDCDVPIVRADERVRDPERMEALPANTALLVRAVEGDENEWVLFCARDESVRVNGLPVAGMKGLLDRDEVRLPLRARFYFSTERPARVVPFPGAERAIHCGRCKRPIEPASPAVRCPECGVWHHQDEAINRPCWTYGEVCGACPCPTEGAEGFRWWPDGL